MSPRLKQIAAFGATAIVLAACTAPDGSPLQNSPRGAAIGGLFGSIPGAGTGDNTSGNTATTSAQVAPNLDRQQTVFRAAFADQRVKIVSAGAALVVTLPQSLAFEPASTTLRASLQNDLGALATTLVEFPNTAIVITAHTDNAGPASQNMRLSVARAGAVMAALAADGVMPGRMRAVGRGEERPVATNLTPAGRAKNRRIEITIRPTP